MIKKASELMGPGEKAIVIFTRGAYFIHNHQSSSATCNWVAGEQSLQQMEKAIIYLRKEEAGINQVYAGEYAGWRKPLNQRERRSISSFPLQKGVLIQPLLRVTALQKGLITACPAIDFPPAYTAGTINLFCPR